MKTKNNKNSKNTKNIKKAIATVNNQKAFDYSSFSAHLEKLEKEQAEKAKQEKLEQQKKEQAENNKPKKFVEIEKKPVHYSSWLDKLCNDVQEKDYEQEKMEKAVVTVLPYIKQEEQEEQKKLEKEQAREKATDKTKLYYELSKKSNVLHLVVANIKQNADGSIQKKNIICKFPVGKVSENCKPVSEFIGQVFYEMCLQLSYTALNTIYVKSCNSLVLKLMRDLIRIWKMNTTTAESFEQYVIAKNNCKELMKLKTHTRKLVTINVKGKKPIRKFVETIPFDTLEKTKTGKEVLSEKQFQLSSDVNDIVNTGVIACLELYQLGMIRSVKDVFSFKNYIYKSINSYIWRQKNGKESYNSSLEEIIEEHGEKADYLSVSAENAFLYLSTEKENEQIDNSELLNSFKLYLLENFKPVRKAQAKNKEMIVNCWIENRVNGVSMDKLAIWYNISGKTQIARYVDYIDNFITDNYIDIFEKFNLVKKAV